MANFYPPVGFHFKVEVLDLPKNDLDLRFTEAGGLNVEVTTEEFAEGGENRFTQRYPVRPKYPDLTLKRGLIVKSAVWDWIRECVEDFRITVKPIDVTLLNESHEPLVTWHVIDAYPTRWSVADFNANSNTFVVEQLQFAYKYFTRDAA